MVARQYLAIGAVLLAAVLSCHGWAIDKDFCKNMLDGNYADPYDCSRYIICSGESATSMLCPPGLHFNEKRDQCDWPASVKCTPRTRPNALCAGKTIGIYPDPLICSRYYYCNGFGVAETRDCPAKTTFHPLYKVCVWKGSYSCKGSNFCQGRKDGNYQNTENCATYYACAAGLTYKMDCPKDLWYNPVNDQCDYPKNVKCNPGPPTTATVPDVTTENVPVSTPAITTHGPVPTAFCNGKAAEHYADPTSCRTFYVCNGHDGGRKESCPELMNFFPSLKVCVWESTYTCAGPNFCVGKKDGDYQNLNDCGTFYACSNELTHVMDCPKGLWFNSKTNQCDYPSNVDCKQVTTSTTVVTAPASVAPVEVTDDAPASFCVGKLAGIYPDAKICSTFYVCEGNDRGVERKCPKKTNFFPNLKICVWESTYSCLDKNFCLGKADGNYQNVRACATYYACSNGLTYEMKCPADLWYNPVIDQCDNPASVACAATPATIPPPLTAATPEPATTAAIIPTTKEMVVCDGRAPGMYPSPRQCSEYYICLGDNTGKAMPCPPLTVYNPNLKVCVWESTYSCTNPNFCAGKKDGNYQNLDKCDTYYACVAGLTYLMDCPKDLWYNPLNDQCDFPKNVQCKKNEKRSEPGFQEDLPSPNVCIGKTAGAYQDPVSCQLFVLCDGEGFGKVMTCPRNTNFHPRYKVCVWSHVYSCSDPNFCESKKDGNYKNLNDCYGYYACSGGLTYSMSCPAGLRYNGNECVSAQEYGCEV